MSTFLDINNLKNHFICSSAPGVLQVTKPLFELLGINYFSMHRVYTDGSRARLTTNADWLEHYYSSGLYLNARLERHPVLYHDCYSLWDEWPENDDSFFKVHKHMRELYDKDHGFSVIKNYKTHMDVFILTAPSQDKNINYRYLRHLEEIKKFLGYFMSGAAGLIEEAHKNRFFIPMDNQMFLSDDGSKLQDKAHLKNFYAAIYLACLKICTKNGLMTLTKRETDCLGFLLQAKSTKEIAKELSLSPRTVESYVNTIKIKLDVDSTSALIEIVRKSDVCEYLQYRNSINNTQKDLAASDSDL